MLPERGQGAAPVLVVTDPVPDVAAALPAAPDRADAGADAIPSRQSEVDSGGRGVSDTHVPPSQPSSPAVSASGRPIPAPPTLHVGRVLAERWVVGPRIGMGGMASVHHGHDRRLERSVAIKILHPHIAENPDARTRLAREAKAIAQLRHESVIEVYDYDISEPDCTWLVTELIEGASLRQALDRSPRVMPEIAVMIMTEVVRALRAAHQVGVVHRDVKPDNVLVGRDGRPKLSDFGIAQIASEERMTLTGNLVGSPSYMSPEQAEGRRTDHRTDLFSAGTMLYRIVTGTLPFTGSNAIETLRKVAGLEYVDPAEIEPSCPGPVAGVIRRALAARIEDRYQTADALLRDLGAILQDAGLAATSEELPRYFADPELYQLELTERLARTLTTRGQALLDEGDEPRALDCLNRAMTLGGGSERTVDLVKVLSRRRDRDRWARGGRVATVAATIVLMVGAAFAGGYLRPRPPEPLAGAAAPAVERPELAAGDADGATTVEPPAVRAPRPTSADEPAEAAGAAPNPAVDGPPPVVGGVSVPKPTEQPAEARAETPPRRTRRPSRPRPTAEHRPSEPSRPAVSEPPPEPPPPAATAIGVLHVGANKWGDVFVDGRRVGRAPNETRFELTPGEHRLRFVNPHCNAEEKVVTIRAGETTRVRVRVSCP